MIESMIVGAGSKFSPAVLAEVRRGYGETAQEKTPKTLSAIDKLYLPQAELANLLDEYMVDFDMLKTERREYAEWLAAELVRFRGTTPPDKMLWVNDGDDSDNCIQVCRKCGEYPYWRGAKHPMNDQCKCFPTPPDLATEFGNRYRVTS